MTDTETTWTVTIVDENGDSYSETVKASGRVAAEMKACEIFRQLRTSIMQAMTKQYDEAYENETVRVEIALDNETAEYRVWHRGCPDAVYCGPSFAQAEDASGLSADEWNGLLMSDNLKEFEG